MSISRFELGKLGEDIACSFLVQNDYIVLDRNFRTRYGEIDIIAKYSNIIIFVEVKTRSSCKFGIPSTAIDYKKVRKLIITANYYLYSKHIKYFNIRFDAIEVYYYSAANIKINHIKQII